MHQPGTQAQAHERATAALEKTMAYAKNSADRCYRVAVSICALVLGAGERPASKATLKVSDGIIRRRAGRWLGERGFWAKALPVEQPERLARHSTEGV